MGVNAARVLRKYKKLFNKLGLPAGQVTIRLVDESSSKQAPAELSDPISLGRVIINDETDRELFGNLDLDDFDLTTARIHGGAIEESGLYEPTEDALRRAQLPGGAVIIRDREYSLLKYTAGFQVQGVVMQWSLALQGSRGSR